MGLGDLDFLPALLIGGLCAGLCVRSIFASRASGMMIMLGLGRKGSGIFGIESEADPLR